MNRLVSLTQVTSDGYRHLLGFARNRPTADQVATAMRRAGYTIQVMQTHYLPPKHWKAELTEIVAFYQGRQYNLGKYEWDWLTTMLTALRQFYSQAVTVGIEDNPTMRARDATASGFVDRPDPVLVYERIA